MTFCGEINRIRIRAHFNLVAYSAYLDEIFKVWREIVDSEIRCIDCHQCRWVLSHSVIIDEPFHLCSVWSPGDICCSECYLIFWDAEFRYHLTWSRILFVSTHIDVFTSDTFVACEVDIVLICQILITFIDTVGIFHELEVTISRVDEWHIVESYVIAAVRCL